jgi:methionine synthase I (cobalamin-dependent)
MSRPHLLQALRDRVLLCDGGTGARVQQMTLDIERDFWGKENCTDVLCLSCPDIVREIHRSYFEAGADMVLTAGSSATSARAPNCRALATSATTPSRRRCCASAAA